MTSEIVTSEEKAALLEPGKLVQSPPIPESGTDVSMRLIEMAIHKDVDIDRLERLMQMHESFEQRTAQREYFKARSHFQVLVPDIRKTKKGYNDNRYAPLGDIAHQIREALNKCGLSYRFEFEQSDGQLHVTCIVSHYSGFSERTSMTGPMDTTGNKNEIQALASSSTYLMRYCLIAALGLTTADDDLDGRLGPDRITDEQAAGLKQRLADTESDVAMFCKGLGIADVDSMPPNKFAQADRMLSSKEVQTDFVKSPATKKGKANADN